MDMAPPADDPPPGRFRPALRFGRGNKPGRVEGTEPGARVPDARGEQPGRLPTATETLVQILPPGGPRRARTGTPGRLPRRRDGPERVAPLAVGVRARQERAADAREQLDVEDLVHRRAELQVGDH